MPNGRPPSSPSAESGSDPSAGAGSPGGSDDGTRSSKQSRGRRSALGERGNAPARPDVLGVMDGVDPMDPLEGVAGEPLDVYSALVVRVAETLTPRVAALRIRSRRGESAGSGVVLTAEGHLVTNAHVVGDASSGEAAFADGTTATFEVIGRDPLSDLAVLRADRGVPTPPEYGDA